MQAHTGEKRYPCQVCEKKDFYNLDIGSLICKHTLAKNLTVVSSVGKDLPLLVP